jgi:hypothetical protein
MRRTASGRNVVLLPNNLKPAPHRRRPEGVRMTKTDTPTRTRTSKPTPTEMPHRSSNGCRRTSPLRPCCCAAAQRRRHPRRGGCASS